MLLSFPCIEVLDSHQKEWESDLTFRKSKHGPCQRRSSWAQWWAPLAALSIFSSA